MSHHLDPRSAWEPYQPSVRDPWDLRKAGHLLRRASFSGSWPELEQAVKDGPGKTIDRLLQGGPGQETFTKTAQDMAASIAVGNDPDQARAWWLFRLLQSPHPLREKLTLCWHNHFATSVRKVLSVKYMLDQNELMRRHALGSFREMLQEMSRDPAMMIWLDTNLSKRGMPNENYARELMELFSLGIGNYTEKDIREAARAFTGWEIKNDEFFFNRGQHDATKKTVLGRSGEFKGEDIVNICLEQSACPYFITGKLYRFFISESEAPSRELLEPLAEDFRKNDYDIGRCVSTILRSRLFFAPENYRARVKSPTDFGVGIVRSLEGRVGTLGLASALDNLGQRLFDPPSVKGWDGGTTWLNSTTLLHRNNLALALTSTQDQRFGRRTDPAALVRKYGKKSDEEIVDFFITLFLQGDLSPEARSGLLEYMEKARHTPYPVFWTKQDIEDHRIRAVCHLVLAQPEYQLE